MSVQALQVVCINKVCKAIAAALRKTTHAIDTTNPHKPLQQGTVGQSNAKLSMDQTSEDPSQITAKCLATTAFESVQACSTECGQVDFLVRRTELEKAMLDIAQVEQLVQTDEKRPLLLVFFWAVD